MYNNNGKRNGKYNEWGYNGKKVIECFYSKGKKEGKYKEYNNNNKIISYLIYENDEVVASLI